MLPESMILPEVFYLGRAVRTNNPTRGILLTMAMIVSRMAKFIRLYCHLAIPTVTGRQSRAVTFGIIRDGVDYGFSRLGRSVANLTHNP